MQQRLYAAQIPVNTIKLWSALVVTLLFLTLAIGVYPLKGTAFSLDPAFKVEPYLLDLTRQAPGKAVRVIVQKSGRGQEAEQTVRELGGKIVRDFQFINSFSAELTVQQLNRLAASEGVKWISYDAPLTGSTVSADQAANLTNLYDREVGAAQLWNRTVNGASQPWLQGQGIGVAVVDSGVLGLRDLKLVAEVDDCSCEEGTEDLYGHGTAVAGIIGGNGTASAGKYIGIAPAANIINVKVSNRNGKSTVTDLLSGLVFILQNKAAYNIRVVNLSFNSSVASSYNRDPLDAAVEVLWFSGIVIVVSGGNNGTSQLYAPANDPFVITVGASDDKGTPNLSDDIVAPFSAWGIDETGQSKPDLIAPGRNLVSTFNASSQSIAWLHPNNVVSPDYVRLSGTSMAAPVVSGAVALLLQSNPNLNPDQVKYRLKATALKNTARDTWDTRTPWAGYNPTTAGAGYLDIYAAITQTGLNSTENTGKPASQLLWFGNNPVTWSSVNWSSVNWSSVNWSSVNWSSVNWSSVNWSSVLWD